MSTRPCDRVYVDQLSQLQSRHLGPALDGEDELEELQECHKNNPGAHLLSVVYVEKPIHMLEASSMAVFVSPPSNVRPHIIW